MTSSVAYAECEGIGKESGAPSARSRTVVVVSADAGLRQRLTSRLTGLRWQVLEASGGAEAMMHVEEQGCEAMLIDAWLPDLEANEFAGHVRLLYPAMEVLRLGEGGSRHGSSEQRARSPRRNELLHAVRAVHEREERGAAVDLCKAEAGRMQPDGSLMDGRLAAHRPRAGGAGREDGLPELVGGSEAMREVARLVEVVAPRGTAVLIEGETGTGKEMVAKALHRLSRRAGKPLVVLNCAAIPESLLEAELFGHTRGAFTGAVQSRVGRIESANGGTLLLDEIGEMPIGMQAKMLRFLESGELQKVGDNEMRQVDVRLIAATHQPLEQRSAEGTFRMDLYHRLAVFPIEVPPLRERMEDITELAEHFLEAMGRGNPRKRLSAQALERLQGHSWPGNVRELMHVLERGAILAGANPEIAAADILYRRMARA